MNRYECTKKVGLWGIMGNIFLLCIKFIVALFSHSQALLADSINSFGDIFSSIMTFIGNKIAGIPRDEDHNFGHGKAEYIFSMLISVLMIVISCKILVDSLISVIFKKEFIFSVYLIIVCVATILVKLFLYLYTKKIYQNHANILIKASMRDHRNDIILTMGTLISIVMGYFGFYFFDGIIAAIISIYILISGLGIFLESYKVLMDVSIDKKEKDKIIKYIMENTNVKGVNDFNTIAVGYKYIAVVTIDLDGNLTTFASHAIADILESTIPKKFHSIYKVTIHVNPV